MKSASPDSSLNPFDDPDPAGSEATLALSAHDSTSSVLTVDRNATLTLGTDALIVLDEGLRHRRVAANCCGLLPQFGKTTRAVPFHSILWAELNDFDIAIHYAQAAGRKGKACRVGCINYTITDKSLHAYARRWVDKLVDRAYPPSTTRKKRIKVLVNPFGGQGNAQKLWTKEVEPIFAAAHCKIDVERTTYKGHAVEIAEHLDLEAYDVVACASGDGLPHEVFNGLAKRPDARRALRRIAVCQLPCGSGNAMSLNLNGTDSPSLAAVEIVKGIKTPLDLVAVTQGNTKIYSFLSQAAGVVAETDLGTESLRWMGSFRFTWGIIVRMLGKTIYPAELSVVTDTDDKRAIREEYRRVAERHHVVKARHRRQDEDEDVLESGELGLPPLKYGTAADDLHPDFVTTDHPQLGNFYAGNMCYMSPDAPFFAAALPSDGKMDLMMARGDLKRATALKMLVTVENGGLMNFPEINYSKVIAYRIKPRMATAMPDRTLRGRFQTWLGGATSDQTEGLIAIDGERIPFEPFQAEVIPRLGTVLSKNGIYEFDGPKTP